MLAHLVESDLISALLLSDHGLQLLVHLDVSEHQLSTEIILGFFASQVSSNHFRHFFLLGELSRPRQVCSRRYALNPAHVPFLVGDVLRFDVRRVRLLVVRLRNLEGLLYFRELRKSSRLFANIGDEFFGRNEAHILPSDDEAYSIHLHLSLSR